MPIADSNPERRNLTLLSFFIILYFLGGASFEEKVIKLPLINLKFENYITLGIMVWLLLAWFLFRYRITNKNYINKWSQENNFKIKFNVKILREYLTKHNISHENSKLSNTSIYYHERSSTWKLSNNDGSNKGVVKCDLEGTDGLKIRAAYFIKTATNHSPTTDYYTPYILCYFSVFLGVIHFFNINIYLFIPIFVLCLIETTYLIRSS